MDSYISSHSSISESIHEKIQRDQSDIDRKLAAARERFRKAKAELQLDKSARPPLSQQPNSELMLSQHDALDQQKRVDSLTETINQYREQLQQS